VRSSVKSWLLVIIQFACLLGMVLTGPIFARGVWLIVQVAGAVIGVWALAIMRLSRLNVLPDVRDDAELVRSGPYRYIRHPMYTSLLMMTGAMVASLFSVIRLVIWAVLLVNLLVKLSHEEKLLAARFAEYEHYRQSTKRLIPGVY
jgi:protein-S-isoprenylcysteine O-methyltransferase Ste14